MAAPKTPTEETPPAETPGDPEPTKVCAICGEPATRMSNNPAYSVAYYCDNHDGGEPLKSLGS